MKKLIIIGAGGHGKVVADVAVKNGYESIFFLDDNENAKACGAYPVVGKSTALAEFDGDVFAAIGNAAVRKKVIERVMAQGRTVPVLIHPSAVIANDVTVGEGTLVAAGAIINPGATVGKGCIINTASSVDHDCRIADYVHVSVGAHVAGTVQVDQNTWIGAGATVSNNITVCADCMIGAGAVVVKNITESGTYVGVPAERK